MFALFALPFFRHDLNSNRTASSSTAASAPSSMLPGPPANRTDGPDNHQTVRSVPNRAGAPEQPSQAAGQLPPPPKLGEAGIALHQKMAAGIYAHMREDTKRVYGEVFQQLGVSGETQEKVLDILTQPQRQLEQQAFEAAQAGTFPTLPSPETMRAQQALQDQQLRSLLGENGFAALKQYQASIPDRTIVQAMNQQGADLSASQSRQLFQILTEARQQIVSQSGVLQNLAALPPEQAAAAIEQQQTLLQQTVSNRTQHLLTPEQGATLQSVMSQFSLPPKRR
jgi:hypothetical protein